MKARPRQLLTWLLVFFYLLGCGGAARGQEEDYSSLCHELQTSGLEIVDSGVAYGVPLVQVNLPRGSSITAICRLIPSFNRRFNRCRNRLAFFNALNPSYVKTRTPEPYSIVADTLKIPLDFRTVPEIFPASDDSLASFNQYLLVDIGKGFMAFYEQGALRRVYPISAGTPGEQTPLFDFQILDKDKDHYSSIFGSWMPWALHLKEAYYIHGGVLPGQADSAGCIRLPIDDAEQLFNSVAVGTPGRIIATPKVEQEIYPAPFCR